MNVQKWLLFFKTIQISIVVIHSFYLSASIINYQKSNEKTTSMSQSTAYTIGYIGYILGGLCLGLVGKFFNRVPITFIKETIKIILSLLLLFIMDVLGLIFICGWAQVVVLWPHLASQNLIYFCIGNTFALLMIENFTQGYQFMSFRNASFINRNKDSSFQLIKRSKTTRKHPQIIRSPDFVCGEGAGMAREGEKRATYTMYTLI